MAPNQKSAIQNQKFVQMSHFDPAQIERYLLAKRDWVSVAEICQVFGCRARALRQLGSDPGLATQYAISHPRMGLKHVANASTAEYLHAKHAMARHAISELRRKAAWDRTRSQLTRTLARPPIILERDTGQLVMDFEVKAKVKE